MRVLVTGAAGFIGHAVSKFLLARGDVVVGLDVINDYYDPKLKRARLADIGKNENFIFHQIDLSDREVMEALFAENSFDQVIHLAAQAGVRYSMENPHAYISSNVVGFLNILEGCRHSYTPHVIYASSSSVYGANKDIPFSIDQRVDTPISLYAATKKSNEMMAYTYAHLYALPVTGLRFFTVYGPWGRPDMSPTKFAKKIQRDEIIDVYNYGDHKRDFTYIDDIVEGIVRLLDRGPVESKPPAEVHNIGSNQPVKLMYFIEQLEKGLGKIAEKNMLPMQPGDVKDTFADIDSLVDAVNYQPSTSIEEGVKKFIDWFEKYYKQA